MSDLMRLAVVGTGYIGLTTGVALAYLGHRVTCVDKDDRKLSRLAESMRTPVLLDGRNLFDSKKARQAGLTYLGVGR